MNIQKELTRIKELATKASNEKYLVYSILPIMIFSPKSFAALSRICSDLSGFDKGIYTIELKDNNTTYTEKVIVE